VEFNAFLPRMDAARGFHKTDIDFMALFPELSGNGHAEG
jgi:hypothetical protein